MATSIYFAGRLTYTPGVYIDVDASALGQPALGASGIVAVLGEAEGGAPYSVKLHKVTNPGKVPRIFRDGDLKEAAQLLFDPANDSDIPGGAPNVIFGKVNPSTQASRIFVDSLAANSLTARSRDYGAFVNKIAVAIANGTNGGGGKKVTVEFEGVTESFDDIGKGGWFRLVDDILDGGGAPPTTATIGASAFTGQTTLASFPMSNPLGDSEASVSCGGRAGEFSAAITPGNAVQAVSDNAADTAVQVIIYGIVNGTGLPGSETITLNGTTPVVSTTVWARIHAFSKPGADPVGTVSLKDGVGGTVMATFTTITGDSYGMSLVGGLRIPGTAGALTVVADAATTAKLLIVGTNGSGTPTMEEVTLNGTTPVTSSTSWRTVSAVMTGLVASARTLTFTAPIFWRGQAQAASLVSDNAADVGVPITVVGLNAAGAFTVERTTLNGTTPVVTSTSWSAVFGWLDGFRADPDADDPEGEVTVTAVDASLLNEDISVSSSWVFGLHHDTAGAVAVDFTAVTGGRVFIVGTDSDGQPATEAVDPNDTGNTTTEWSHIELLAIENCRGTITDFTAPLWNLPYASYRTLAAVKDFFASYRGATFTLVHPRPTTVSVGDMDPVAGVSITSEATFYGLMQDIVSTVNAQSGIITFERATGATKPPANTSGSLRLNGGSEGTTGFANWQAALDRLKGEDVNTIVVLTSDAAVHAAVVAHCKYMAAQGANERDAILGAASAETLEALQTRSLALNTRHVRLCHQDVVRYNTAGEREQFPPYFTACIAAGMQAGTRVGTSLTWKYLNVLDVVGKDSSYIVVDDKDTLISSGLLSIEFVQGQGFRWVRNVTTYQIDDNPAFCEGAVNEAVNYTIREYRRAMEALVGDKAFDGTVATAKGYGSTVLSRLANPDVGALTQYRNQDITITGDVMEVDVEIAPIQSVNFVRATFHLVTTSLRAAA